MASLVFNQYFEVLHHCWAAYGSICYKSVIIDARVLSLVVVKPFKKVLGENSARFNRNVEFI